jgi:Flp pilus assembly protein TadD
MAQYREAVRLMPEYADARNGLAILLMDRGEVDEAIVHLTEAVRRRPAEAQLHNNLAAAFAQLGRMETRRVNPSRAVRLEPNRAESGSTPSAWRTPFRVDTAARIFYLEAALRLDPAHARARRALADIRAPSAIGRGR